MNSQLHVLVVDDSALMRKLISDLLKSDPVVGEVSMASDGDEALRQIAALHPDVVTLDVEMPRMSGLEVLERIMHDMPLPVVMLSGLTQPEVTLAALELGAVDFVLKPSGPISVDLYKVRDELLDKVKMAVLANATKLARLMASPSISAKPTSTEFRPLLAAKSNLQWLVVVAASTGGPRALDSFVQGLPGGLPAAILVVQHMPRGFTASLAKRLDAHSELVVKEAEEGETIEPGQVYIAPAGYHLRLTRPRSQGPVQLCLDDAPPVMGLRPAADLLMASAAQLFGERCIGVILTGMGSDGTRGIQAIKQHGGLTIAQDQATSVIYGMPRSAVNSGCVDQVLPLDGIAPTVVHWVAGCDAQVEPSSECLLEFPFASL